MIRPEATDVIYRGYCWRCSCDNSFFEPQNKFLSIFKPCKACGWPQHWFEQTRKTPEFIAANQNNEKDNDNGI